MHMAKKAHLLQSSWRKPPLGIQRALTEETDSPIPSVAREATSCLISHPVNVTKRGSQQPNYSPPGMVPLDLPCHCNTEAHTWGSRVDLCKCWSLSHRGPMSWDNRTLRGCF